METGKTELNNKIKKVLIGIEIILASLIVVIVMGNYLGDDMVFKCGHIEKGITIFLITTLSKLSEYLQTINIDLIILIIFLINTVFLMIFCIKTYRPTKEKNVQKNYSKKLIVLEVILAIFITIILGDYIFVHRYGTWSACYYYKNLDLLFIFGLLPMFILLLLFLIIKNQVIKKVLKIIITIILILYAGIIAYISFSYYSSYIEEYTENTYIVHSDNK